MENEIKKVALIGAGAVGSYFISGLAEHLKDDFVVIANGKRGERLKEKGVTINDRSYHFPVKDSKEAGVQDLVLIATKYQGLGEAIRELANLVGEDTIVISLLNGVTSEEKIGQAIGIGHLLYANMRIASSRKEGRIYFNPEITAGMFFGEPGITEPTKRAQAVIDLFEKCNLGCHYQGDILKNMWSKYAANVSQNLPQAILSVGHGAYIDSQHVYFIANKLWKEVAAVAKCKGVELSEEIELFFGVKYTSRYSTLQDLDAGRHTEIEMLAGNMIEMGQKCHIPTPYCEYTYHLIKALEEKNEGKFDYSGRDEIVPIRQGI